MAGPGRELVLLPGLDGTGVLFNRLRACLDPAIPTNVTAYPPDPALGYDQLTELVRKSLGQGKVVLLGESFSGPIAINVACRLPDQILGLVLVATFLRSPYPARLVRAAAALNHRRISRRIATRFLMGSRRDSELEMQLEAIIEGLPADVRSARLREVANVDVRKQLDRVTCPVLALHGLRDWVVPAKPMLTALRSRRGARVKCFETSHMLLQTVPEAAAAEIASFIRSTPEHS